MRLLIIFAVFLSAIAAAQAADTPVTTPAPALQAYDKMANFIVAVSPQFSLERLGSTGEPALTFATAFPQDARNLSVVGFRSKDGFYFRLAAATSQGKDVQTPYLAVQIGDQQPLRIDAVKLGASGALAAVSAWSNGAPAQGGAYLALTFADGSPDPQIYGVAVTPAGWVALDLGGAKSLGGSYELRDLDGDGSYELLTERSLDGWNGGITYIAVRTFDASVPGYRPNPDRFKDFYRGELAFYDWVLSTRDKMLDNPESYMSNQQRGWYFAADYNGRTIGFDSLVPLPDIQDAGGDIKSWNQRVDAAVKRVTDYRDQLKAWLDGSGSYPAAWQMKR